MRTSTSGKNQCIINLWSCKDQNQPLSGIKQSCILIPSLTSVCCFCFKFSGPCAKNEYLLLTFFTQFSRLPANAVESICLHARSKFVYWFWRIIWKASFLILSILIDLFFVRPGCQTGTTNSTRYLISLQYTSKSCSSQRHSLNILLKILSFFSCFLTNIDCILMPG